jgi:hypothetical protein
MLAWAWEGRRRDGHLLHHFTDGVGRRLGRGPHTDGLADQPVGQDRDGQGLHVVRDHVVPVVQQRLGLGRPVQADGRPRTRPQDDVRPAPGGLHDVQHVVGDGVRHLDRPHPLLQPADVGRVQDRPQVLDRLPVPVLAEQVPLGRPVRVPHVGAQQEPVELALRQRVGALELVRVLGGDDEERRPEPVRLPVERHLPLAHRFEQRRLGPRRGPVHLVGQHHLGEQRAGDEPELPGRLVEDAGAEQVGRQQVRGELDPAERAVDAPGQGLGQERLAHPGDVFQQQVAVGQEGHQGQADDLRLAQDHRGDVGVQRLQVVGRSGIDPHAAARAGVWVRGGPHEHDRNPRPGSRIRPENTARPPPGK